MTEEEFEVFMAKRKKPKVVQPATKKKKKKKNKYGARTTWRDGVSFDSIKEADYYSRLKLEQKQGLIAGYILHGKMICTTGGDNKDEKAVIYEPDFIVLNNDGTYRIIDTKSEATITPLFKTKMKALREKFPDVEIEIQ